MSTQQNSESLLRIVLIVLAVIILAPILMMVLAFPLFGMWGGGMMGGFGGTGGGSLWGLGMSLVWLVVLLGVGYLVYRGLGGGEANDSDPAIEELRMAYARGDLTEEEFEERREQLSIDEELPRAGRNF